MHVLYVHQHFGTPQGTGGTRSYEFARRLVEAGHEVTMVCGASKRSDLTLATPFVRGRREGMVDGIRVVQHDISYSTEDGIPARVIKFLRFGLASVRIALTGRYDLIFATSTPLTAALPGIAAKVFRSKPFVFEVRDLWPELPRALGVRNPLLLGGMSALEWLGYRSADRMVGLAPGIVEGIVRRGVARDRVSLIPNGCDNELFDACGAADPLEALRDRVEPGDFIAIFAGAHGIANGLEALLPVAADLKRRGRRDIRIVLIGSGATKAPLQAEAERQGLTDQILFLDPIPKTALIPLLKAADAGLQILKNVPAFYSGTSPNKFFDYLAAGLPVIVNYPGWVADLVRENGAGAAVPPDDPVAFADALVAAADDRDGWRARGPKARRLAEAEFDRDRLANRFLHVIEGAASGRPVDPEPALSATPGSRSAP